MKLPLPVVIGLGVVAGLFGLWISMNAPAWVTLLVIAVGFGAVMFSLANLRSNRTVTNASAAEREALLTAGPPAGRGRIIVFRQGFIGKALGVDVTLDGVEVAQLKAPRFVALDVVPGEHVVGTAFKGTAKMQNRDVELPVVVGAGETVAVRMTFDLTLGKNEVTLAPVAYADVKRALSGMTMVRPDRPAEPAAAA